MFRNLNFFLLYSIHDYAAKDALEAEMDKEGFDQDHEELRAFSRLYPTIVFEVHCREGGDSWIVYYKNGQKHHTSVYSLKTECFCI